MERAKCINGANWLDHIPGGNASYLSFLSTLNKTNLVKSSNQTERPSRGEGYFLCRSVQATCRQMQIQRMRVSVGFFVNINRAGNIKRSISSDCRINGWCHHNFKLVAVLNSLLSMVLLWPKMIVGLKKLDSRAMRSTAERVTNGTSCCTFLAAVGA